ncbi:hypothetical protein D3C80_1199720 [compost metagenome]
MGVFRCGATDLVVAALEIAITLDRSDHVVARPAARAGLVPFDGEFIAGDKAAPTDLCAEVEEGCAPRHAAFAR